MKNNLFILQAKTSYISLFLLLIFHSWPTAAQQKEKDWPYTIRLESYQIIDFPALQSFAFASFDGKWLLLGGRKDGLHRRQPWASFDEEGQNNYIYVVDPVLQKSWKQSVEKLPANIREQLQSTNMEFTQTGNKLIIAGGYGYSKTKEDHITFPNLTVIKVDSLMDQIMKAAPMDASFIQIKDERMAVTGGRMGQLGDTLILVGGQLFNGRYNPMGPDHGPGFEQVYSNEIRKFILSFHNNTVTINYYNAIRDTINLHRRDYNLIPQVFQNKDKGYTIFSGVFQYEQDLPYLNPVDIIDGKHSVNNHFEQKLSHYHSAFLPLYDQTTGKMYTLFFGGIAQYYPDKKGKIIANEEVPFTKTISLITRKEDQITETYLDLQMPGYLGAAAEFIFSPDIPMFKEGIANTSILSNKEIFIGYIVGGINSSEKNIFWTNTGNESKAEQKILKVYIRKNQ